MSIEENIIKTVSNAVEKVLTSKLKEIEKEIAALKAAQKEKRAAPELMLIKDAAARLKISKPKVKALIEAGELKTITPPGGRMKILESSLNEYIAREAL